MKKLANLHYYYKISSDHFATFGKALLQALGDILGDRFTDDVKKAWEYVYRMIVARVQRLNK